MAPPFLAVAGYLSRELHWGVGNGWAAAGMVRVLKALPEKMQTEKSQLSGYLKEVIDGCLAHQCENSLFHDIVDDSSTFIDSNLTQMLSYSICRSVRNGWFT